MSLKADYQAQLSSNFILDAEPEPIELELIEVSDVVAEKTESGQVEPFSALFRHANLEMMFDQGSYTLKHDELGELLLFLVPIGPDEIGMRYEAIFT